MLVAMTTGVRAIAAGALGATLAACQALLDFKPSIEPTATDGSVTDATLEDGSAASDAHREVATCNATFCDDFDESPIGARWDSTNIDPDGGLFRPVIELVDGGLSPPYAMRIAIPGATTATTYRIALLERRLGEGRVVTCAFDLFIESPTLNAPQHIDILTLAAAGPDVTLGQVHFAIEGDPPFVTVREDLWYGDGGEETPKLDTVKVLQLPSPGWNRIEFQTDFYRFSLRYGPTAIATDSRLRGFDPTNIRVAFGMASYRAAASAARFDNFECTVQ